MPRGQGFLRCTKPGAETRLKNIPTSFGTMSLTLRFSRDGRSATLDINPPRQEAVEKIVAHLEHLGREVYRAQIEGKDITGGSVTIPTTKETSVSLRFKDR